MAGFERERGQQSAQPGARDLGEHAVIRPDLEWPEHPDLHELILSWARTAEAAVRGGHRIPFGPIIYDEREEVRG